MTTTEFRDRLVARAVRADLALRPEEIEPLGAYFRLLVTWNRRINLTSLPLDPPTDETFDRLFIEALAAARFMATLQPSPSLASLPPLIGAPSIHGGPVRNAEGAKAGSFPASARRLAVELSRADPPHLRSSPGRRATAGPSEAPKARRRAAPATWFDLGSGGGSPAIPLKIALPELELTMIESKSRKAAFLSEVTRTLDMRGATVLNGRFEEVHDRDGQADMVTVRAVRSDATLELAAARLLRDGGWQLAFRATAEPVGLLGFRQVAIVALKTERPSWLHVYARMFHVEQNPLTPI